MASDLSRPVRDLLAEDRISCARIRRALLNDATLGRWCCGPGDPIRTGRLAALVRRSIWQAHDMSLETVRRRLAEESAAGELVYDIVLEIDTGSARPEVLRSSTWFRRGGHGRIVARVQLDLGGKTIPLTRVLTL